MFLFENLENCFRSRFIRHRLCSAVLEVVQRGVNDLDLKSVNQ